MGCVNPHLKRIWKLISESDSVSDAQPAETALLVYYDIVKEKGRMKEYNTHESQCDFPCGHSPIHNQIMNSMLGLEDSRCMERAMIAFFAGQTEQGPCSRNRADFIVQALFKPIVNVFPVWFQLLLATAFIIAAPIPLEAQTDRYELGRRVKRYEIAWQKSNAEARARSTASMQKAVSSFFAFNFKNAARAIDGAYAQLTSQDPPVDRMKWLASRQVIVNKRVVDSTATELSLLLVGFYESQAKAPKNAKLRVIIKERGDQTFYESTRVLKELKVSDGKFQFDCQWKAGDLGAGDFRVCVDLVVGEQTWPIDELLYSQVEGLDKRLASMKDRINAVKETATPTGYQTLRLWRNRIQGSCAEGRMEIDYPVFQLLEHFDTLCAQAGDSVAFVRSSKQRDFWMSLRQERKRVPIRIRIPKNRSTPRPVLFLFHGAGGSDNMFFETYGAGRCVELADQRDWIVVSPNQGILSRMSLDCQQMLDLLGQHLPVDRRRVFFVGHSMGAAQVITQVFKNPELPAAAVALGGGRGQRETKRLLNVPWFVAAGEADFGRPGAKALHQSLKASQANTTYREYENVEHMVIVQAALDDVFAFLDKVARQVNE